MATSFGRCLSWVRYSGASIAVTLNPCSWSWQPRLNREYHDQWQGPDYRSWSMRWLFLTVIIWIDNGSW